jgi:hypothetical protein
LDEWYVGDVSTHTQARKVCVMAAKKPARSAGSVLGNLYRQGDGASALASVTVPQTDNHFTLGTPWEPTGAPMPDPLAPLTERGDDNTLLAPDRAAGLGFSRYV